MIYLNAEWLISDVFFQKMMFFELSLAIFDIKKLIDEKYWPILQRVAI